MIAPSDILTYQENQGITDGFIYYYHGNVDPFHYDNAHFNVKYPVVVDVDGNEITELQYQCDPKKLNTLEVYLAPNILQSAISSNDQIHDTEDEVVYFFHGDHLGSAHWITNYKGLPIQYLHYAPYGELMADQQVTGRPYDERFKFTGKERDSETNYDYFGARFYSSLLGHWLSVDPLSDKYPSISPYAYCAWNPVKFSDKDGRKVGLEGSYTYEDNSTTIVTFYYDVVDGVGGFYHNGQCLNSEIADLATNAIESIRDGGKYGKMLVDAIVNDDRSIVLTPTITKPNQSWCLNDVLIWNLKDFNLGDLHVPSYIALCHEFAHFISFWYGFADLNTWYKDVLNDEKWAVNVENLIRKENHLETRRYYDMPSTTGGLGEGEIPQWNWIGNYLKILSNF